LAVIPARDTPAATCFTHRTIRSLRTTRRDVGPVTEHVPSGTPALSNTGDAMPLAPAMNSSTFTGSPAPRDLREPVGHRAIGEPLRNLSRHRDHLTGP
jgi:hypothetical protein